MEEWKSGRKAVRKIRKYFSGVEGARKKYNMEQTLNLRDRESFSR